MVCVCIYIYHSNFKWINLIVMHNNGSHMFLGKHRTLLLPWCIKSSSPIFLHLYCYANVFKIALYFHIIKCSHWHYSQPKFVEKKIIFFFEFKLASISLCSSLVLEFPNSDSESFKFLYIDYSCKYCPVYKRLFKSHINLVWKTLNPYILACLWSINL